jgi:hypothetical protein
VDASSASRCEGGLDGIAARAALIEFASSAALRSAAPEDIDGGGSFYRRPVRVEDLSAMDFSRPLSREEGTSLRALAAQRLLLCSNEATVCAADSSGVMSTERLEFYRAKSRGAGAHVHEFLHRFAFAFLDELLAMSGGHAECERELARHLEETGASWSRLFRVSLGLPQPVERQRLLAIQRIGLRRARAIPLDLAEAAGFFRVLPRSAQPAIRMGQSASSAMRALYRGLSLTEKEHAYWQFYLTTSLAEVNWLHTLASQPERPMRIVGAALVANLESAVSEHALLLAENERLGVPQGSSEPRRGGCSPEEQFRRARSTIDAVARGQDHAAVADLYAGVMSACALLRRNREDLRAQVEWTANIKDYCTGLPGALRERIRKQGSAIERETFHEPRAMCSTTHVHDDDRLVEIESGRMVFWAAPGMRLRFDPGDALFVPRGRLHGSSVESDICVYHQPIIPRSWIEGPSQVAC